VTELCPQTPTRMWARGPAAPEERPDQGVAAEGVEDVLGVLDVLSEDEDDAGELLLSEELALLSDLVFGLLLDEL
jgi:hypothetical protein